ncbi:RNA 2',3'-cyclic phosphodiesterase [Dehalogenimonas sp. 4OHTPN]|uniref:RNA 2',3'-cyclic phosphodiesterase n=1 Tax=Dehalogenimonas sp. 4OHTPN TaxID=3166643 RepID=A0AAU8GCM2_9CHLR
MTEAPSIRAFIAVELPEPVKTELAAFQRRLAAEQAAGIKWVSPNGIHLTLKFLGQAAPGQIEAIRAALATAVEPVPAFELGLSGLGAFPNLRRMNVVWCGLSGGLDRLVELQRAVEAEVSPLGFPAENRAFSPHLTLARLREDVSAEARQALAKKLAGTKFEPDLKIPVEDVSLMQSTLLPRGAEYRCLASFRLAGRQPDRRQAP